MGPQSRVSVIGSVHTAQRGLDSRSGSYSARRRVVLRLRGDLDRGVRVVDGLVRAIVVLAFILQADVHVVALVEDFDERDQSVEVAGEAFHGVEVLRLHVTDLVDHRLDAGRHVLAHVVLEVGQSLRHRNTPFKGVEPVSPV